MNCIRSVLLSLYVMLLYSFSCIKRTRTIYKSHLQSNHNSIKTRRRSAAKRTTQTKISHWDAFVLTEFFLRLPSCVPSIMLFPSCLHVMLSMSEDLICCVMAEGCPSFSLKTDSITEISVDVVSCPTKAAQSLTTTPAPITSEPRFTVPATRGIWGGGMGDRWMRFALQQFNAILGGAATCSEGFLIFFLKVLGQHGSCNTADLPGELSDKSNQNLPNKWPPHPAKSATTHSQEFSHYLTPDLGLQCNFSAVSAWSLYCHNERISLYRVGRPLVPKVLFTFF